MLKGLQSVEVLGFLGIPAAIPLPDLRLPGGGQLGKEPLGALFHHVVEAEAHPVRQAGDKGVLLGESPQRLLRVGQGGDSWAISTVNSSASPITARKPRVFSGRDSSMAAVNMA